jgi:hypothetical protein
MLDLTDRLSRSRLAVLELGADFIEAHPLLDSREKTSQCLRLTSCAEQDTDHGQAPCGSAHEPA